MLIMGCIKVNLSKIQNSILVPKKNNAVESIKTNPKQIKSYYEILEFVDQNLHLIRPKHALRANRAALAILQDIHNAFLSSSVSSVNSTQLCRVLKYILNHSKKTTNVWDPIKIEILRVLVDIMNIEIICDMTLDLLIMAASSVMGNKAYFFGADHFKEEDWKYLSRMASRIWSCNDTRVQMPIIEILFGLSPKYKQDGFRFCTKLGLPDLFMDIELDSLEKDIRGFLNILNVRNNGITSYPKSIQTFRVECFTNNHGTSLRLIPPSLEMSLWIDFGMNTISCKGLLTENNTYVEIYLEYSSIRTFGLVSPKKSSFLDLVLYLNRGTYFKTTTPVELVQIRFAISAQIFSIVCDILHSHNIEEDEETVAECSALAYFQNNITPCLTQHSLDTINVHHDSFIHVPSPISENDCLMYEKNKYLNEITLQMENGRQEYLKMLNDLKDSLLKTINTKIIELEL